LTAEYELKLKVLVEKHTKEIESINKSHEVYCKKIEKDWKERLDSVSHEKNQKIKELEEKNSELTAKNLELSKRLAELETERLSHIDKISHLESAILQANRDR